MICNTCGKECGTDRFCTSCGAPVATYLPPQPPPGAYYYMQPCQPTPQQQKPKRHTLLLWSCLTLGMLLFSTVFSLITGEPWDFLMSFAFFGFPLFFVVLIIQAIRKKYVVPYIVSIIITIIIFIICMEFMPDSAFEDELPENDGSPQYVRIVPPCESKRS